MILRDRCSTSYDLASLFRGKRSALNRWNGKIAQFSIFEGSLTQNSFVFNLAAIDR